MRGQKFQDLCHSVSVASFQLRNRGRSLGYLCLFCAFAAIFCCLLLFLASLLCHSVSRFPAASGGAWHGGPAGEGNVGLESLAHTAYPESMVRQRCRDGKGQMSVCLTCGSYDWDYFTDYHLSQEGQRTGKAVIRECETCRRESRSWQWRGRAQYGAINSFPLRRTNSRITGLQEYDARQ